MFAEFGKYLDNIIMLLGGCYALYLARKVRIHPAAQVVGPRAATLVSQYIHKPRNHPVLPPIHLDSIARQTGQAAVVGKTPQALPLPCGTYGRARWQLKLVSFENRVIAR